MNRIVIIAIFIAGAFLIYLALKRAVGAHFIDSAKQILFAWIASIIVAGLFVYGQRLITHDYKFTKGFLMSGIAVCFLYFIRRNVNKDFKVIKGIVLAVLIVGALILAAEIVVMALVKYNDWQNQG